jgi:hypothetical protein
MNPRRGAGAPSQRQCAARRIWELDPADLALVTGVLLRREDVESLLDRTGHPPHAGTREDALRVRLLLGCTVPCAVAEAVEQVLDGQTQEFQATIERCPMMQIADWWSGERDRMTGEELAALLWRLACDPRPHLEPLVSRVGGHLRMRAMQLLRDEPDASRNRPVGGAFPRTPPLRRHAEAIQPTLVDHPWPRSRDRVAACR